MSIRIYQKKFYRGWFLKKILNKNVNFFVIIYKIKTFIYYKKYNITYKNEGDSHEKQYKYYKDWKNSWTMLR